MAYRFAKQLKGISKVHVLGFIDARESCIPNMKFLTQEKVISLLGVKKGQTLWLIEVLQDLEKSLLGFIESWESCNPKINVLSQEILKLYQYLNTDHWTGWLIG